MASGQHCESLSYLACRNHMRPSYQELQLHTEGEKVQQNAKSSKCGPCASPVGKAGHLSECRALLHRCYVEQTWNESVMIWPKSDYCWSHQTNCEIPTALWRGEVRVAGTSEIGRGVEIVQRS